MNGNEWREEKMLPNITITDQKSIEKRYFKILTRKTKFPFKCQKVRKYETHRTAASTWKTPDDGCDCDRSVDNDNKQEPQTLWRSGRLRYDIMSSWNLIYDRTTERLYGKIHIVFISSIMIIIIKGRPSSYKIMNIWVPYRRDHLYSSNGCEKFFIVLGTFFILSFFYLCFLGSWWGRWIVYMM